MNRRDLKPGLYVFDWKHHKRAYVVRLLLKNVELRFEDGTMVKVKPSDVDYPCNHDH